MTLFTFFKSATQKYRVITNPEAVRLMNDEEAVVIDLRPIDEFQRGHIIGSVNLLPTESKSQCRQNRTSQRKTAYHCGC